MLVPGDPLPPPPARVPDLAEDFTEGLSEQRWVAHYLPHWTTADSSAARYAFTDAGIALRIEAGQLDWRPEDAPLRVSNLQTGTFSGPIGSGIGTHRHRPDGLTVRTPVPSRLLFAPASGRVEVTVSASSDPGCMTAVWLVGTEHRDPRDAGEICVFEIDADAIGETATTARTGVKAHGDARLTSDMAEVIVPVCATDPHTWTVIWGAGQTIVGCQGVVVRAVPQAPDYPLFLMIDLFEVGGASSSADYPKSAVIHSVRGWAGEGA